jgi:Uma2 family endonuclease
VAPSAVIETLADLLAQLGDIGPARVRFHPHPGTATEQDVLEVQAREGHLCELVAGVLVEKGMGFRESYLAGVLIEVLRSFVRPRNLGLVTGDAGMMRLTFGLVRIPDVAFISWDRLPGGCVPQEAIPSIAPDLAIEVLSESNTVGEMTRKRGEYFAAGVLLVWQIYPVARTVAVYTAPEQCTVLDAEDILDGGAVLPGFTLPLQTFFAELDVQRNTSETPLPNCTCERV